MTGRPGALLALPADLRESLFTPPMQAELAHLTELADLAEMCARSIQDRPHADRTGPDDAAPLSWEGADPAELARTELLITGWDTPAVDAAALAAMPRLRAVVHTAGTLRHVLGEDAWARADLALSSATAANAIPVAEYTLAQILLAGKRTLRREALLREHRGRTPIPPELAGGNHGSVAGLIGASHIGRLVAQLLRPFDVEVLVSDPVVPAEDVAELGATSVPLPELLRRADVVSLHAPDLPATRGMIGAEQFALMRTGTTFINTARPALVDEDALRAELTAGRIAAVLDVHDDLAADDPLWDLPAVSLTPHLAGSAGNELHRLGASAVAEVRRFVAGEPLAFPVDRSRREVSA